MFVLFNKIQEARDDKVELLQTFQRFTQSVQHCLQLERRSVFAQAMNQTHRFVMNHMLPTFFIFLCLMSQIDSVKSKIKDITKHVW